MNSFTVELFSKASNDCHPNKTLSTFTYFLPEQTNLEREWEVAVTGLLQWLYQRALIMSPRFPSQGLLQTLCPSGSDIKKTKRTEKIKNVESMKNRQSSYALTKLHSDFF